ncbi:Alpha-amylase 1 [bioreactor metagenome]|uniref:Alpha-amylase 1 n=1 Tax=bioreactor metagenome TaxID=1076179 RepID=A0A644THL3_9ZZZZ
MQGIKVIFGTYNTMPDGASDTLFELSYQRSWRPFLSSLYKFPSICSVLYYSGIVLQWIEENHPEFILLLEEMSGRRQIELLGGGYYSPLFPILQLSDKVGQIELLTTYLRKTFGKRPSGGWLYEYSWDAGVPLVFKNSGLSYSFLPAGTLAAAGIVDLRRCEPVVTEEQRKLLCVFPVFDMDEAFESPMSFESALENLMARHPGCRLYTIMANGHSVPGMWEASGLESPDVMFEKTFAWFQKNCLDIETVSAQNYTKSLKNSKLFYLSSCSSRRLGSCLDETEERGKGLCFPSIARQLILQQPASKRLYDKMYHVHSLMSLLRGDKARKKSAQEDLWKAQNGEAFWEGCIGGLRRPEVRKRAYRALIDAEKATRLQGSFNPGLIVDDIDCDGEKEFLYQAGDLNCYIHSRGASVFELDCFKNKHNYCSVFPGSKNGDSSKSFVDMVFEYGRFGRELAGLEKQYYGSSDRDRSPQKIQFFRDFSLPMGESLHPLGLRKSFLFQKHCVSVDITLHNRSEVPVSLRYAQELNFLPLAGLVELEFSCEKERERLILNEPGKLGYFEAEALFIQSAQARDKVELRSDRSFTGLVEHFMDRLDSPHILRLRQGAPQEGPPGQMQGEELYQGSRILLGWDIELGPDSTTSLSLSLHI